MMHAHAREGNGGCQIGLNRPVMMLPGGRLWGLVRGLRRIFMQGDALVAGQEVSPGKGSSTLAEEGLLLGV